MWKGIVLTSAVCPLNFKKTQIIAFTQSNLQYTLFIIRITFKIHFYKHIYLFILGANKYISISDANKLT